MKPACLWQMQARERPRDQRLKTRASGARTPRAASRRSRQSDRAESTCTALYTGERLIVWSQPTMVPSSGLPELLAFYPPPTEAEFRGRRPSGSGNTLENTA